MAIGQIINVRDQIAYGNLARRGDTGRGDPFGTTRNARNLASFKAMVRRQERHSLVIDFDFDVEVEPDPIPVNPFAAWESDWDEIPTEDDWAIESIETGVLGDYTYAELAEALFGPGSDTPDIDGDAWGTVLELACTSEEFVANDGFVITTGDFYRAHERQL